jgi:SRSO17 transposase
VSLRQYVDGLLGDSARKSMSAMLERISEPTSYQAFQHFITHAPWDAEVVWRRLRAVTPARAGILILDETSFPKSGVHSVGVARQYCGALGKVANCQVAVTAALWAGQRAWPMGALLYLPDAWTSNPAPCAAAGIPATVPFHEKWRLAVTLVRRTRAAGVTLTALVADAEYGDNSTLRQMLHRLRVPYALGISPTLTVFRGTPRSAWIVAKRHHATVAAAGRTGRPPASGPSATRCRLARGGGSRGTTGPIRRGRPTLPHSA